ncbi:MAG: hypothetical protein GC160_09650 [Acidobacteria bacterium]|nr:hypothetical protein [Acidobacteriota bacterium]
MSFFNAAIRVPLETFVSLFGDAHPLWSLSILSVLIGIGMLWVFGATSNQKAIERAKKKMQAYLLELRLYGDDPALLFKAQRDLILSNLRYMGLMLVPALYLTIPMVVLLFHLDAIYGIRSLEPGERVVLTMQAAGRLTPNTPIPELSTPDGFVAETPAVRALEDGQYSWRLRADKPGHGELGFKWMGSDFTKSLDAGSLDAGESLRYVSPRRESSLWGSIESPGEDPLSVKNLDWIEVRYPGKEIALGSLSLHWLVWFLVISMVSAYALKGFFGVTI